MIKVSVLIPVHGDGQFLEEALNSVFAQEDVVQSEIEILVVLDRPTPLLTEFLKSYKGPNFQIARAKYEGIVGALNMGLEIARGSYIARLDSDDFMHPLRISKQMDYLKNNPEVLVVGTQVTVIDSAGQYCYTSKYETSQRIIREFMKSACCISHPSTMFRRDAIIRTGGYRNFFRHAEDFDLWTRVLEIGEIAIMDEPLTSYRTHPGQISQIKSLSQQLATQAVIYSAKLRARNKVDLTEKFESIEDWGKSAGAIFVRLKIWLIHQYAKSRRNNSLSLFFSSH